MTVTTGHFTLTPEQRQFHEMLSPYPQLAKYWNFQNRDCDLDAIEKAIGVLSTGEQHMLRFFVALWLGENRLHFDLINALKTLDTPEVTIIQQWAADPFWP